MFAIVGIIILFGCVIGGFLMEKGNLPVLVQPSELVTIGGTAIGTVLTANPMHVLKKMVGGLMSTLKGSPFAKQRYVDTLKMMFDLFTKSRKEGAIAIESDVEDPEKSPIFSRYPAFLKDHHARDFVCDTMRMAITGGVNPFDVDQMMELDMDVHHHSESQPHQSLTTVADSLPGLGIVAAVLGELSTDRANAARRLMQESGIRPNQVAEVRGYADQDLLKPLEPHDASNRRVTLIVHYVVKPNPMPGFTSDGSLPQGTDLSSGVKPTAGTATPATKNITPDAKPAAGKPAVPAKEASPLK
jgi:flagellar motor component MotA